MSYIIIIIDVDIRDFWETMSLETDLVSVAVEGAVRESWTTEHNFFRLSLSIFRSCALAKWQMVRLKFIGTNCPYIGHNGSGPCIVIIVGLQCVIFN